MPRNHLALGTDLGSLNSTRKKALTAQRYPAFSTACQANHRAEIEPLGINFKAYITPQRVPRKTDSYLWRLPRRNRILEGTDRLIRCTGTHKN